jgi:glycerol-1-phosphate dehydrogenase [NAD(P)+]
MRCASESISGKDGCCLTTAFFANLVRVSDALSGRTLSRRTRDLIQIGRGGLEHALPPATRGFTLVTQPGPRAALPESLLARAGAVLQPQSLARADLGDLVASAPHGPAVVGVGGGVVMDSAKWLAFQTAAPLLLAPSILSVDACVTNTVAVRDGARVSYEGFVVADQIILDVAIVQRAPDWLNRAGAGDLLSIHTALRDWAAGDGQGAARFDAAVARRAAAVLDTLEEAAGDVAAVTEKALSTVLLGYADINDLTVECGHAQMEEGSEHYLAYYLEQLTGTSFVHGEVVTLGSVIMSRLQRHDPDRVERIASRCGVRWRPAQLGLSRELLITALAGLADYVRETGLPPGSAASQPLDEQAASELIQDLA